MRRHRDSSRSKKEFLTPSEKRITRERERERVREKQERGRESKKRKREREKSKEKKEICWFGAIWGRDT